MNGLFNTLARMFVGTTLAVSGWLHLSNPYEFLQSVYKYQILDSTSGLIVAGVLPFLQLVVGICLVLGCWESGAWIGASVLAVVFLAAHFSLMARGMATECGCFGVGMVQLTQMQSFMLATLLGAVSIASMIRGHKPPLGKSAMPEKGSRLPQGTRQGMTLVELLVVISIIGLLMALLLPAVQFSRESARRVTCQNNLKQLSLAISMYHDAHRNLPINISPFYEGLNPAPQRNGKGWIVSILPQLERHDLYQSLSRGFDGDFFSGGGLRNPLCADSLAARMPMLNCPSDPEAAQPSLSQGEFQGTPVTVTNYKGVIGDTRIGDEASVHGGSEPDCHRIGGCNGLFHRNTYQQPISFGHVTDGLSNTLMLGEDVPAQNNWSAAFYANGDHASCNGRINFFPNTPQEWWNTVTFRSHHPGGAQFTMADGSVRFVPQTVDIIAYRAMSTRAGRETVSTLPSE